MLFDAESIKETGLTPLSVAARVLDVAERARMLADDALDAGYTQSAIKAGEAELRALGALASMGIRHEDVLAEAASHQAAINALVRAARKNPAVAEAVAAELDTQDRLALARDIREVFTTKKEIEK